MTDVRFVSVDGACCCTDAGVTIASAFKIKKGKKTERNHGDVHIALTHISFFAI